MAGDQWPDIYLGNERTNLVGGGAVSLNAGPGWKAIGTGDFNADGLSDILFQNTNGQAEVWDMSGTNVIGGGAVNLNPGPSWQAKGTGDFNGDGYSDILWQNANGQTAVWENERKHLDRRRVSEPQCRAGLESRRDRRFRRRRSHSDILLQNPG